MKRGRLRVPRKGEDISRGNNVIQRFLVRHMKVQGHMELQVVEDHEDGIVVKKRILYEQKSNKAFKNALLISRKIAARYEETLRLNEKQTKGSAFSTGKKTTAVVRKKMTTTRVRRKRTLSVQERKKAFLKNRSYKHVRKNQNSI